MAKQKQQRVAGIGQGLRIHLAPTTDGASTYMQITSLDGFSVNLVLVAPSVVVDDQREAE